MITAQSAEHNSEALQAATTPTDPQCAHFLPVTAGSVAAPESQSPPKHLPLRSLSWGSKSKAVMPRPPQRRNTAEASTLHRALPPRPVKQQDPHLSIQQVLQPCATQQIDHEQVQQDEQQPVQQLMQLPVQQIGPQPKVEQWLLQHQPASVPTFSQADTAVLRQQVLQEVLQAITSSNSTRATLSSDDITVQVQLHNAFGKAKQLVEACCACHQ